MNDVTTTESLFKTKPNYSHIDIQAMLMWLTLPFYDFFGFRSLVVNSVYKLPFLTFIYFDSWLRWYYIV